MKFRGKLIVNLCLSTYFVLHQFEGYNIIFKDVQVNLIITLSLGSLETDHVISEPCYNEVIYNRHNHSKIINLVAIALY